MDPRSPDVLHPAVATRHLITVATELGASESDLLAGTPLTRHDLVDPDADVSMWDEFTVARNVLARLPDPTGIGVATGLRFNIANLGLFGFAAMACPTLRELMATALRFFTLTTLQVAIHEYESPTMYRLTLDAVHLPADVRSFFVARDIAAISAVVSPFLNPIVERFTDRIEVEIGLDEQHLDSAVSMLPLTHVAFDRPSTLVRLPPEILDEQLPQADEHTMRACLAQCEELVQRRAQRAGITAQVRARLIADPTHVPHLDTVAQSLHIHPRTLRRRLANAGTSWRALNNEVRSTLAAELLTQVGLTVEEASKRLGYSETAAFTHAFIRWHGIPPSKYRSTGQQPVNRY
jgi:AraC-like DNA-binding protein